MSIYYNQKYTGKKPISCKYLTKIGILPLYVINRQ